MFDRLMKRCGTRASGEQTLLAGVCVLAGLVTALAIVAAVHCQRRICLRFETSLKRKSEKLFSPAGRPVLAVERLRVAKLIPARNIAEERSPRQEDRLSNRL